MTALETADSKRCNDCFHFEGLLCAAVGVCKLYKSDHCGHILHIHHQGCPFWESKV